MVSNKLTEWAQDRFDKPRPASPKNFLLNALACVIYAVTCALVIGIPLGVIVGVGWICF